MLRLIGVALLKAFIITAVGTLIYVLYGLISSNPYELSLTIEIIFFLVTFLISLIEYIWENRKKKRI